MGSEYRVYVWHLFVMWCMCFKTGGWILRRVVHLLHDEIHLLPPHFFLHDNAAAQLITSHWIRFAQRAWMISADALRGQVFASQHIRSECSHSGSRRSRARFRAPGSARCLWQECACGRWQGGAWCGRAGGGVPGAGQPPAVVRGLGGDHAAVLCAARHHPPLPHLTSACRCPIIAGCCSLYAPSVRYSFWSMHGRIFAQLA